MTKTQIKQINDLATAIEQETNFLQDKVLSEPSASLGAIRRAVRSLRALTLPPTPADKPAPPPDSRKITSDYARMILSEQYSASGGNVSAGLRAIKDGQTCQLYRGCKLIYVGDRFYLQGTKDELKRY